MSTEKKAETAPKPEAPATPPGSHIPVADVLKSTFSDKNNLMALLAAAGASGLLGGYVSSKSLKRPGETPGQRRARILANALGAGAAGGGAVGAGLLGYNLYNSRLAPPPGLWDKIYDSTAGKLPALSQAGLFGGGAVGTYMGGVKGVKELAADKAQALTRLQNAGKRVEGRPITADDIQEAFSERADPANRNAVRSALRRELNPAARSMSGLGKQNISIEEEIARAGLHSKLGPGAKAKLSLGNNARVAGKAVTGGAKGGLLGAGLGFGGQLLWDYVANKAGQ